MPRSCAADERIGERLPLQVLHHEELHAVLRPDVVERADVRVIQGRDHAAFELEALSQPVVHVGGTAQDLDGNPTIEASIARAIDVAHTSGTEFRQDFVRPEPYTRRHVHRGDC